MALQIPFAFLCFEGLAVFAIAIGLQPGGATSRFLWLWVAFAVVVLALFWWFLATGNRKLARSARATAGTDDVWLFRRLTTSATVGQGEQFGDTVLADWGWIVARPDGLEFWQFGAGPILQTAAEGLRSADRRDVAGGWDYPELRVTTRDGVRINARIASPPPTIGTGVGAGRIDAIAKQIDAIYRLP